MAKRERRTRQNQTQGSFFDLGVQCHTSGPVDRHFGVNGFVVCQKRQLCFPAEAAGFHAGEAGSPVDPEPDVFRGLSFFNDFIREFILVCRPACLSVLFKDQGVSGGGYVLFVKGAVFRQKRKFDGCSGFQSLYDIYRRLLYGDGGRGGIFPFHENKQAGNHNAEKRCADADLFIPFSVHVFVILLFLPYSGMGRTFPSWLRRSVSFLISFWLSSNSVSSQTDIMASLRRRLR